MMTLKFGLLLLLFTKMSISSALRGFAMETQGLNHLDFPRVEEIQSRRCSLKIIAPSRIIEKLWGQGLFPQAPAILLLPGSSVQNYTGEVAVRVMVAFKHSLHCYYQVMVVNGTSLPADIDGFQNYQLRSLAPFPFNVHPQQVHYIFMAESRENLQKIFDIENVRLIQYKSGVVWGQEEGLAPKFEIQSEFDLRSGMESRVGLLSGKHFKTVGFNFKPMAVMRGDELVGGVTFDYLETLSKHYNFTYEYSLEGSRNFKQMRNGSWYGYIGDLMSGKSDIVTWLTNTYERNPYVDSTTRLINNDLIFFTPLPRVRVKWQAVFYLLDLDVWLLVFLSLVLTIPLFYLKFRISGGSNQRSWAQTSVMLPFQMMLQQPPGNIPQINKLLLITFLFYTMLINTFFNSNLMAFLTFPESEPVPQTARDLVRMKNFNVNLIHFPGGTAEMFFQGTTNPLYLKIRSKLNYVSPPQMKRSMVNMALEGGSVVINYKIITLANAAENLTLYQEFNIWKESKTVIDPTPVHILLRKYSKLTEPLSFCIGKLHVGGLFLKWFQDDLNCAKRNGMAWLKSIRDSEFYDRVKGLTMELLSFNIIKPFTLEHFVLAFVSLALGCCVSFIVFGFEVLAPVGEYIVSRMGRYRKEEDLYGLPSATGSY